MRLEYLAYRNMVSKPMTLVFNLLLLALSVALVSFILELNKQVNKQLEKNIAPVDLVVGAKGSHLQLVLSSVLHIDDPAGNIEFKEAKKNYETPFLLVQRFLLRMVIILKAIELWVLNKDILIVIALL